MMPACSGGMKRRLSVAMAFIARPKVIFLDEPSTGECLSTVALLRMNLVVSAHTCKFLSAFDGYRVDHTLCMHHQCVSRHVEVRNFVNGAPHLHLKNSAIQEHIKQGSACAQWHMLCTSCVVTQLRRETYRWTLIMLPEQTSWD